MADEMVVDRVRSETTRVPGRSLNQARTNHFVIDTSSGSPEAITSMEAFLAGISSCGVNVIHKEAEARGLPLAHAEAVIEARRLRSDTSTLAGVRMSFTLSGVSQKDADELVATYTRR